MARTGVFDETMYEATNGQAPLMAVDSATIQKNIEWDGEFRGKIRQLINGMYDTQKLRIATGNRIVAQINQQMGVKQDKPLDAEEQDKMVNKVISVLKNEYKRITDAYVTGSYAVVTGRGKDTTEKQIKVGEHPSVKKIIEVAKVNDPSLQYIRDKMTYDLVSTYIDLLAVEEKQEKIIATEVKQHPLWDRFFKDVTGVGPVSAGLCLAYLDIHKARHSSSFIMYCGLDVVPVTETVKEYDDKGNEIQVEKPVLRPKYDEFGNPVLDENGEQLMEQVYDGRSRKHTVMVEYVDKNGNLATKRSLSYQPFLKSKMVFMLGTSFLKCGKKADGSYNYYAGIYYDYRNRLQNNPRYEGYSKDHIHNMAVRYMIKCFLRDLWATWRELAGYVVTEPYEVQYLGRAPHKYNEYRHQIALRTAAKAKENAMNNGGAVTE